MDPARVILRQFLRWDCNPGKRAVTSHAQRACGLQIRLKTHTVHDDNRFTGYDRQALSKLNEWSDPVKVRRLLGAFRRRGHLAAQLDPLREATYRSSLEQGTGWRIGGRWGDTVESIDICRLLRNYPTEIDLSVFGLERYKEDDELPEGVVVPRSWGLAPNPGGKWTFRSFVDHLTRVYVGTLAVEHQHVERSAEREWLEQRLEERLSLSSRDSSGKTILPTWKERRQAWSRLARADRLESFFAEKFPKAKRFGILGCEALLPGLWALLEQSAFNDLESFQLGMPHRGRLNVLVNFFGKKVSDVCSEFDEQVHFLGDVKYHLGTRSKVFLSGCQGRPVHLTLAPNPSHLELVGPVVLGMTRAKQDNNKNLDLRRSMAVLIHGDAAFSGQGIVAECMQLADLPAYTTGGTIHIVIDNRVGFTTDPRALRSSYHCTNVAKINDAPIIHVNADDVDAVLFACKLAAEYRHTFRKDIVIDFVCYRRFGHNESDDASLTQPLTSRIIMDHTPVLDLYSKRLIEDGVLQKGEIEIEKEQTYAEYMEELHYAESHVSNLSEWAVKDTQRRPVNATGLPEGLLKSIGEGTCRIPESFRAHDTVKKIFAERLRMLKKGYVDWAMAENLAIGSLLHHFDPEASEGLIEGGLRDGVDRYVPHPPCPVRLSGQDVERGTFNQRHAIIHDQATAMTYNTFTDLGQGRQAAEATICNSSLSETAVLGYEYGYSLEESMSLTIWEAQFGDFANIAQPIIDTFISSGEAKWGAESSLVLLLPHGYEGMGADHSSARLERFLQLVDEDPDDLWPESRILTGQSLVEPEESLQNSHRAEAECALQEALSSLLTGDELEFHRAMRRVTLLEETYDFFHYISVVNISTPANIFHALRRQVHRTFQKPLVVMSGKYLLHHRPCRSPLRHMAANTHFQRVIYEGGPGDNMPAPQAPEVNRRRLIFCSGKVFYELYHARATRKLQHKIALVRLEQISPFPSIELVLSAMRYPEAELVWVQEEPKNMGAWAYVAPRMTTAFKQLLPNETPRSLRYIGRPPSAIPATPLFKHHKLELRAIIDDALSLEDPEA